MDWWDFRYHVRRNLNPRTIWYNLKYGIWNLITWFLIIWRDRDWDYHYLYMILHKKFRRMEHLQRKYGNGVDAEKYADQIRICRILLSRLIADDYFNHDVLPEREWNRDLSHPLSPESSKKVLAEAEREEQAIERDLDMLFKIMRKHVRGWWD